MIYSAPHLKRAAAKVIEDHPVAADPTSPHHDLSESRLYQRLRAKVADVPLSELGDVVRDLNNHERSYFSHLLDDETPVVRERALRCLYIDDSLGRYPLLWKALSHRFEGDFATSCANLIRNAPRFWSQATQAQKLITEGRRGSVHAGFLAFWEGALRAGRLKSYREAQAIPKNSELTRGAWPFLLTEGAPAHWAHVTPATLLERYQREDIDVRSRALQNARRIDEARPATPRKPTKHALALVGDLIDDTPLQNLLKARAPDTWRWCEGLLRYAQLSSFFGEDHDNERFEFWEDYVHRMVDLTVDTQNMRAFMDFGGFGVVEFGEVGNATYVYPREHFIYYRDRSKKASSKRSQQHKNFKSKKRSLTTMNHGWEWQTRFRAELSDLFEQYA